MKLVITPNGSLMRAEHIVSVSPVFKSSEALADVFAVYVVGHDEPFLFWAQGTFKTAKQAEAATEKARVAFVKEWLECLNGNPFLNN